ncbi:MAG: hypothetical protein RML95_11285 [Anaerolineae bacterium]|nr:hypothetical protein [Anaerolineae bacterium]MDW8299906.1 hypothetical protein [Anaerolineae bacterium]
MRYVRLLFLCLALTVLLLSAFVTVNMAPAHAESPIRVIEQSVESRYRDSFIFRVTARSEAGNIIGARIIWRVRSFSANLAYRVEVERPAPQVDLEYTWELRTQTMPPWQVIFYRWELIDDQGNRYRTPEVKAEISDSTRKWQMLSDGKVSVYWYERDAAFGAALLDVARRGFDHTAQATGFTPEDELRVVVFNSQEDFCTIYGLFGCQSWIGGVAIGSITLGWLDEMRATSIQNCDAACQAEVAANRRRWFFNQLIPHELAHAFLNYWMGSRVSALPTWFNEGQAVNNELEGLEQELERVRFLARTGQLERLAVMDARTVIGRNDLPRVRDWYAQAASLVTFLYERWGLESLGAIIRQVKEGKTFETAMEAVTGLSMDEYEIAWRRWLGLYDIPPTFVPTPTLSFFPTPTHEPTPRRP